jgi:hypothetical protein
MSKNSIWYTIYGQKGRMESAREDVLNGGVDMIYVNRDLVAGEWREDVEAYKPGDAEGDKSAAFGHGGSDFYSMYHFVDCILGNENADTINVYEAMDMGLVGMLAYRSVLAGGIPLEIPDLRDPAKREKWRNDTTCVDPAVAGDMLIPAFSKGNPDIPAEVYAEMKRKYEAEIAADTGYTAKAFRQSSGKDK